MARSWSAPAESPGAVRSRRVALRVLAPNISGALVMIEGAGMGAGVTQFGERGQRRPPAGGELGEHVGAEVFGARKDLQPVPVTHDRRVLPVTGECALAAGAPSDSCENSFPGVMRSVP